MMVRRFNRTVWQVVEILLIELVSFARSIGSAISRLLGKGNSGKRVRDTRSHEGVVSVWPRWLPLGDLVLKPALAPAFAPPSRGGVPFDSGGSGFGRDSRRRHR